jgi:hypothetical protein
MFDGSTSVSIADGKWRGASLAAGLLIAGSCFALLFAVMAHLIPLFERFTESPHASWLKIVSIFFVSFGGLRRYLKRRAKQAPANQKTQAAL